jgi:hypothetical protein
MHAASFTDYVVAARVWRMSTDELGVTKNSLRVSVIPNLKANLTIYYLQ